MPEAIWISQNTIVCVSILLCYFFCDRMIKNQTVGQIQDKFKERIGHPKGL